MLKKIPENFPAGSKKCSTHLKPIFSKILVMVQEDSGAFKARLVLIFILVFILFSLCD